jgi:phosphoribosylformylglycinamidine synthase
MSQPKVIILRTAGTNCDEETAHAWEQAGASARRVHVGELIDRPKLLNDYAILTIPGGFSYGDDISAGKILATQVIHYLSDAVRDFVSAGKLVLGICNGFQVLVKAGLLPGDPNGTPGRQVVTLTQNDSARFEDRWVHLLSAPKANAFLPAEVILAMPVAHGEGKLVSNDEATGQRLLDDGHIAVQYCDAEGKSGAYPINPNGSERDIAGLVDATGRILGLMPHPERHINPTQHPQWTRRRGAPADGQILFNSAVKAAQSS